MDLLIGPLTYIVPFLIVLTVLVFVHEMGHYLVARWNDVRVEVFSIGFGPELFGWFDKHGTRWKISAIPFGGYVKFFGDESAASTPDGERVSSMSSEEQRVSFHHKSLGQRAAIVAAGPMANFAYAIVVLAALFMTFGQRLTPPEVGRVLPDSVGEAAGFRAGDIVLAVDGDEITRFEELSQAVLLNPGKPMAFLVRRDGRELEIAATPAEVEREDIEGINRRLGDLGVYPANPAIIGAVFPDTPASAAGFQAHDRILTVGGQPLENFEHLQDIVAASNGRQLTVVVLRDGVEVELFVSPRRDVRVDDAGNTAERWLIGIQRAGRAPVRLGPVEAVREATWSSYDMLVKTFEYLGQMIVGERGTEDLGGPLRIAHVSGQAAQIGIEQVIFLSVLLSLNLGMINLFPVPILDGGHLLLYAIEAVRGRPLTERVQDFAFRIGLALVLTLTVFATWNDLVNLRVVDFIADLFS